MSEEETIGILAEMMATEPGMAERERCRAMASRLWALAQSLGVEEELAEVALAYELALDALLKEDG